MTSYKPKSTRVTVDTDTLARLVATAVHYKDIPSNIPDDCLATLSAEWDYIDDHTGNHEFIVYYQQPIDTYIVRFDDGPGELSFGAETLAELFTKISPDRQAHVLWISKVRNHNF